MKKALGVLGFLLFLSFGAVVWRAYVFAPAGAGSWEIKTGTGGTGVDALFIYDGVPETASDVWRLVLGEKPIKRYEAGEDRGDASSDFSMSVSTAQRAAESVMRQWQLRGTSELEVTEVSSMLGEGVIKSGERIVGINGGPASVYLWREAVARSSRESSPVYLRVRNTDGFVRPVVVTLGETRDGRRDRVYIRVRAVSDEGRHVLLPDSAMHGPSAGLALALGFFNQDTGRCLEVGGEVAATGVVKDNGEVLGVGGVKDKTEAAVAAGNDILLVANSNLESAREAAEGRIRVVGVGRVSEAVLVLADDWRVRECLNESQARERMSEQREDAAWRYKTAVLPAGKSRRRASTQ